MSSLSDKLQVLLQSNVKGNPRNKPNLYNKELVKPLDLSGELNAALINISNPHNWTNLDKSYHNFLLKKPIEGVNSELAHENGKYQTDLYNLILKQAQFRGWVVYRAPQIPQGNYDI